MPLRSHCLNAGCVWRDAISQWAGRWRRFVAHRDLLRRDQVRACRKPSGDPSVWLVLFILIIPSLVFGPRGNYELLHRWVLTIALPANFANEYERDPRYDQLSDPRLERNQSVNAVSIRLIAPDNETADAPARERIVGHVARAMNLFLLLATAHLCRRGRARADDPETLRQFALVILLMLFVSPLSWAHSFTLLALPLAMIAALSSLPPPARFATLHGAAFIAFVVLVGMPGAVKPLQELGALLFCTLGLWLILAWFIDPLRPVEFNCQDHPYLGTKGYL